MEHLVNTDRKESGGGGPKWVSNLVQWETANWNLKLGQLVSNPGSHCDTGGVDCILSSLMPWEAGLFLLGWGLDWTVLLELGIWGELIPSYLWKLLRFLDLICCIVFIDLLFTRWKITILYVIWWYLDRDMWWQGGRQSAFLRRRTIWKYMRAISPSQWVWGWLGNGQDNSSHVSMGMSDPVFSEQNTGSVAEDRLLPLLEEESASLWLWLSDVSEVRPLWQLMNEQDLRNPAGYVVQHTYVSYRCKSLNCLSLGKGICNERKIFELWLTLYQMMILIPWDVRRCEQGYRAGSFYCF